MSIVADDVMAIVLGGGKGNGFTHSPSTDPNPPSHPWLASIESSTFPQQLHQLEHPQNLCAHPIQFSLLKPPPGPDVSIF
ncbi:MAG: hypothetical protein U0V70_03325 [Terriglobia bacterium]